jgi:hypothetical protein
MDALDDYLAARSRQRQIEAMARHAQEQADIALLRLRITLGGSGRPAGAVKIAAATGERRSSVAKRLARALHGTPRPRGGVDRRNPPFAPPGSGVG